jgi:hypothetical protein
VAQGKQSLKLCAPRIKPEAAMAFRTPSFYAPIPASRWRRQAAHQTEGSELLAGFDVKRSFPIALLWGSIGRTLDIPSACLSGPISLRPPPLTRG